MLVSVNEEELVGARKDFYSKAIVSNSALLRFVKVITALVLKGVYFQGWNIYWQERNPSVCLIILLPVLGSWVIILPGH